MLAGLLALLAVLTVRSRFDDPDLWWHLKTGQIIWTTHSIPVTDLFSYTTGRHAWIPHEWLAQLVIYAAYQWGGYSGLMLWLCFFTGAVLIAGYGLCALYSGNAKVAFLGAMAIWFFGAIGFSIRPQLIAYLFLIAELALIHLGRRRNPRWFFWLPALFAVWINCHPSFMLGLIVAAVFLFSSLFNFRSGSLAAVPWDARCRGALALALVLSLAALFLNPVGIRQVLYPIDTMLNMPLLLGNVEEYAPLNLGTASGAALLGVLLSSFLLAATRKSELYFDELLVLAAAAWLAVSHLRMLPVFGILAAPILCRQLATFWEVYKAEEDRVWPNALMIGASLLAAWLAFPGRANLEGQVEAQSPVKAVEFIQASHLSGPMLNDHPFGGYLIWAAPQHPVFIDGRTDVFEWTGVLGEFGRWAMLQDDPHALLDKYGIQFCLLTSHSPMVRVLPLMHDWKLVYSDDHAVVFARTAP
jgi:hypothetical protein